MRPTVLCCLLWLAAAPLAIASEPASAPTAPERPARVGVPVPAVLAPEAGEAQAVDPDAEKLVCVRERRTGTSMIERVCRTKRDRDAQRAAARETVRSGQHVQRWRAGEE